MTVDVIAGFRKAGVARPRRVSEDPRRSAPPGEGLNSRVGFQALSPSRSI
jgi:hypothetical protein